MTMISRSHRPAPSFFWQGLLIVLPVGLLAGLGLLSLRQDQRLATEEARQRARDIVEQLSTGLGRRVAQQFEEEFAARWNLVYGSILCSWPESALRRTPW